MYVYWVVIPHHRTALGVVTGISLSSTVSSSWREAINLVFNTFHSKMDISMVTRRSNFALSRNSTKRCVRDRPLFEILIDELYASWLEYSVSSRLGGRWWAETIGSCNRNVPYQWSITSRVRLLQRSLRLVIHLFERPQGVEGIYLHGLRGRWRPLFCLLRCLLGASSRGGLRE